MKFVDEARIWVRSGPGGNGCISFRRERFVPRGGPDGGDGGKGGDVVLTAAPELRTLLDFKYRRHFKAERGGHGRGKQQTGRGGRDLEIRVPMGTQVYDDETGKLLYDFVEPEERFVLLEGGRGGKGNMHFATPTRQVPRFAQKGQPEKEMRIRLELKLLADAGIVGMPNAGKSTLIGRISAARPKIAEYPFTTLAPQLGVVTVAGAEPFVAAEVPGLIENAHLGSGLGLRFLKHIERTRLLVHLIDLSAPQAENPWTPYRIIRRELAEYGQGLDLKPEIVVFSKVDMPEARERIPAARMLYQERGVFPLTVSAATGEGVEDLKRALTDRLGELSEK